MTRVSIDVSAVIERPAGAARYVIELVTRLAGMHDIELVLVSRANDAVRWSQLAPNAELHAVAPASRPLRLAWEQTALPVLLNRYAPHVHLGPHYTIPELAKVPKVATIHDMTFFDHPEWHERSKVVLFRRAIAAATRKANALIAVSHDTARRVKSRFGEVDITPIPLGVDHARFNTNADHDEKLLESNGITRPYIAFVGTVEPRKDVPSLLRAFDRLATSRPDLRLVVAGRDGWGVDAYNATLSEMHYADRVVRPGYLPDEAMPALLRCASAVAYPSYIEGFGLPALEALACGAPLVTTRGSAMEEVVDDAALLIDAGDVDALTDSLEHLLTGDVAHLRELGPKVAARYTWEATAAAHAKLLARFGK